MTTEAGIEDVPAIVEKEASMRVEGIAAGAAAQIDEANKTAEALARAAEGSHLGTRLQALEEGNATWRAQMEARLTETTAATAAAVEASRLSILEAISKPPPLPIVEEPVVPNASVEQENNSNETDTTKEKTPEKQAGPPPRLRRVL